MFNAFVFNTILSGLARTICGLAVIFSAAAAFAQNATDPDFNFTFDTAASVERWQLLYTGPNGVGAEKFNDNGSLAFIPNWQEPQDYMGYVTDLGDSYDFSRASISADIKFSAVYYGNISSGDIEYLAGSAVILVDAAGRSASVQFWGPWAGNPDEFSRVQSMNGESSLDYVEAGFDITQVRQLGVNLHSLGRLPDAPGIIAYDNIRVDLGEVVGGPNVDGLVDFTIDPQRWQNSTDAAITTNWDGRSGDFTLAYQDDSVVVDTETITHNFVWHPNLTGGRLKFYLTLPTDFAGSAEGVSIQLIDNADRVAVLTELPAAELLFGEAMLFKYPLLVDRNFIRRDQDFNLHNVKSVRVSIDLPAVPVSVNGMLELTELNVQVRDRFAKNRENVRRPTRVETYDLVMGLYFTAWYEGYVFQHGVSATNQSMSIDTFWQSNELQFTIEKAWSEPVSLKGLSVHQRVYIPDVSLGHLMAIAVELTDQHGNLVRLPLLDLNEDASPGWFLIDVDSAMLDQALDLTLIKHWAVVVTRGAAEGDTGVFQFAPPRFTAN